MILHLPTAANAVLPGGNHAHERQRLHSWRGCLDAAARTYRSYAAALSAAATDIAALRTAALQNAPSPLSELETAAYDAAGVFMQAIDAYSAAYVAAKLPTIPT